MVEFHKMRQKRKFVANLERMKAELKQMTLLVTSRLQGQNRNHRLLWLIVLAYACKYAYSFRVGQLYFDDEIDRNFFPWFSSEGREYLEIPLQTQRNYVYLLGERMWQSIIVSLFHWYAGFYITWFLMIYHAAYVFDFLFFFHATPFGTVCMGSLMALLLPLFIKWMKS